MDAKFIVRCEEKLEKFSPIKEKINKRARFTVKTTFGDLHITPDPGYKETKIYSIFMRFGDGWDHRIREGSVKKFAEQVPGLLVPSANGKWNLHGQNARKLAEEMEYRLDQMDYYKTMEY